ncbi:helix-turn-helix domain-containing protein [Tichowtungia aerotolerans]|uniref:Helix-turn-helix domain-containing protein n=2 Tax=Tichowtungia aerotolerans TaxID=2697043 RepID=A0A6P1M8U3_9BACT|nr:helix-turn-helix domain-containing protein [Tichowtungia aerotolerans]
MNEVMSRLHRLFDIRITFFDVQEDEQRDFHIKPMSPFCRALRKQKSMDQKCKTCDRENLAEAKQLRDVHIYHCHAGLIEGIVPLYDRRNLYLGAIVFGQLRDPDTKANEDWSGAQKKHRLSLSPCPMEKARDIGHLLKLVSESMIDRELIRRQSNPWVATLDSYIEQHLHEKITTDDLARQIDKSESFITHHFPLEFGSTPRQHILKRRMEEAKLMLENGTSVQETAERLGFYDAFHFSKTFKRFWNKPPSTVGSN